MMIYAPKPENPLDRGTAAAARALAAIKTKCEKGERKKATLKAFSKGSP